MKTAPDRGLFLGGRTLRLAFCALWLLVLGSHQSLARDAHPQFEEANRLYEEGKYAQAAVIYEALAAARQASPALCFNLGNALFKSGQPGRAIVWYRRAETLAPRDPDIQANLQFVRKTINANSVVTGWSRWLPKLSLNEWTALSVGTFWLWFALLILREFKPDLAPGLRGYIATVGVGTCGLALCLGLVLFNLSQHMPAVVIVPEAVIRRGPLEESQSLYTLRNGAEASVLDQKNDWLQVMDQAKRIGWVRRNQVMMVNPRLDESLSKQSQS